jgi:hypothetical protein
LLLAQASILRALATIGNAPSQRDRPAFGARYVDFYA